MKTQPTSDAEEKFFKSEMSRKRKIKLSNCRTFVGKVNFNWKSKFRIENILPVYDNV